MAGGRGGGGGWRAAGASRHLQKLAGCARCHTMLATGMQQKAAIQVAPMGVMRRRARRAIARPIAWHARGGAVQQLALPHICCKEAPVRRPAGVAPLARQWPRQRQQVGTKQLCAARCWFRRVMKGREGLPGRQHPWTGSIIMSVASAPVFIGGGVQSPCTAVSCIQGCRGCHSSTQHPQQGISALPLQWRLPLQACMSAMAASLEATARHLVAPGKGLLASDESTGTIGKRLEKAGFQNDEVTPGGCNCAEQRHGKPAQGRRRRRHPPPPPPLPPHPPPCRRHAGRTASSSILHR